MEKSDGTLTGIRGLAESTLKIAPAVPEICIRLANMIMELDADLTAGSTPLPAVWQHKRSRPDPVTEALLDYEEAKEIYDLVSRLALSQRKRAERLRTAHTEGE